MSLVHAAHPSSVCLARIPKLHLLFYRVHRDLEIQFDLSLVHKIVVHLSCKKFPVQWSMKFMPIYRSDLVAYGRQIFQKIKLHAPSLRRQVGHEDVMIPRRCASLCSLNFFRGLVEAF